MKLCVRNAYVLSPVNEEGILKDIWIDDGIITAVKPSASLVSDPSGGVANLDAEGSWVIPGLIDLHVHFRDPGFTYKEDIQSGCKAAARGGFTTVCCMPNTDPPIDCRDVVLYVDKKDEQNRGVNLLPVGAVTKGQEGKILVDIDELVTLKNHCSALVGKGICAISEDGKTVMDSSLMQKAMRLAKEADIPVFAHTEDHFLGDHSPEAEEIIVARDILLAKSTGCHLHLCHISTKGSVDLIRLGKSWGVKLTAETAPHYFSLTRDRVSLENGLGKMNPPLRKAEDMEAIREALKDGTIDVIATDHAPHHLKEKMMPFDQAAFGVVGLETAFAVSYTNLVKTGLLTPLELIQKMSRGPAKILGLDRGIIAEGKIADLTIVDVNSSYKIDPRNFVSKGKNTPFNGMEVYGKVKYAIVKGEVIYHDRSIDS